MKPDLKSRGAGGEDFTESHYREILQLVKDTNRASVSYCSIPWGGKYLLWRHDIDISINRSVRLAEINAEHSVHSTFFVNIHSNFYNTFELAQARMLREIISMGHDIGVHFDGAFFGEIGQDEVASAIAKEANLLAELTGKPPVAVSFHNPTRRMLTIDSPRLGGLVNAYSQKLMTDAKYCSDSNGYWRHDRLADIVADSTVERLQVLTHPDWWMNSPMAPRNRVHRAAYGRAVATMADYDRTLADFGRRNMGNWEDFFGNNNEPQFEVPPFWSQLLAEERIDLLFLELWRNFWFRIESIGRRGILEVLQKQEKDCGLFLARPDQAEKLRGVFLEEFWGHLGRDLPSLTAMLTHSQEIAKKISDGFNGIDEDGMKVACSDILRLLTEISNFGVDSGLITIGRGEQSERPVLRSANFFVKDQSRNLEESSQTILQNEDLWADVVRRMGCD